MPDSKLRDRIQPRTASTTRIALLSWLLLSLVSCPWETALEIESLSNQPDKLSGGDALVRIAPAASHDLLSARRGGHFLAIS
jgi:hypothetical protein